MQTLFAISVLCFVGILWAAIALARRIKAGRMRNSVHPVAISSDFKQHMLAAAAPDTISQIVSHPIPQIIPKASHRPPVSLTFPTRQARQTSLHQSVSDITANKQWTLPLQAVHMERLPIQPVESKKKSAALMSNTHQSSAPPRKPPQPTRHGPMEVLDPAYYNKDLGDLTDPYQPHTRLRVNDRKPISNRGF